MWALHKWNTAPQETHKSGMHTYLGYNAFKSGSETADLLNEKQRLITDFGGIGFLSMFKMKSLVALIFFLPV